MFGVLFIIPDSVTLMLFESAPPYHFPTCKHSPTYLAMTWCALQHPTPIADDHHQSTQRTTTAVLHLSRPKIQPTWRSVLCPLCCRVYHKTPAALCSHPVLASCCPIDGASVHEVRQMNPCQSYLTQCLIPRGPDVAIDRVAQLLRVWEKSRMGVTTPRSYDWHIFHGFTQPLQSNGEVMLNVKSRPVLFQILYSCNSLTIV